MLIPKKESIKRTMNKTIGILRNPRVVTSIKYIIVIIILILSLVNKDIDFLLTTVTSLLIG